MTFEQLKETMDCNGYAYFNGEAFQNKTNEVCYIPANAESLKDCFNYWDLKNEVECFLENCPDVAINLSVEEITEIMFDNIEWVFPITYLREFFYE